jgi:hypothetical protein
MERDVGSAALNVKCGLSDLRECGCDRALGIAGLAFRARTVSGQVPLPCWGRRPNYTGATSIS